MQQSEYLLNFFAAVFFAKGFPGSLETSLREPPFGSITTGVGPSTDAMI